MIGSQRPLALALAAAISLVPACGEDARNAQQTRAQAAASAVGAGASQPRQLQLPRTLLKIEHGSGGYCATATIQGDSAGAILDSCHGWHLSACAGLMFAHSQGVRIDTGLILPAKENGGGFGERRIDANLHIGKLLAASPGGARENLHLSYGRVECTELGMEIPFTGSTLPVGGTGSALELAGRLKVTAGGAVEVRLER